MSLWAVTCLFNVTPKRLENYWRLLYTLQECGIPLLTVEMNSFEATQYSTPITRYVQVGGDLMWQKERLLNIGVDALPDDCDSVLTIDADMLPTPPVVGTVRDNIEFALGHHPVIHPYAFVEFENEKGKVISLTPSFGHCLSHMTKDSILRQYENVPPNPPTPGGAWAFHRDWFEKIGGFYDRIVVGGGDCAFAWTMAGWDWLTKKHRPRNSHLDSDFHQWAKRIENVNLGYGPLIFTHLWHGDIKNRQYRERHALLDTFDPQTDLELSTPHSGYRWTEAAKEKGLPDRMKRYFESRKDE